MAEIAGIHSLNGSMMYQDIEKKVIFAKHIWIYGAGIIGKRAAYTMRNKSLYSKMRGFVVTEGGDDDSLEGYPVVCIDKVSTSPEDTFFLIAVSDKYQAEVTETLEKRGYVDYAIWDIRLSLYSSDYSFIDRRKDYEKVCMVLSGYKDFLWERVFDRLKRYLPADVEVCIMSSGLYDERLANVAEENRYSYLYTAINDLTLIQNIALCIYDDAEWIYKMDEDIFLTEGCFEKLMQTYERVEREERYEVGFTAPLMPLNGFSYIHILDHYAKLNDYEMRFGRAIHGGFKTRIIENNPNAAKYMWGEDSGLPHIDEMNRNFSMQWRYGVCGLRYSIGFILFRRDFWEMIGGFVMTGNTDLGEDEKNICAHCAMKSRAMIISHDTVIGHFALGAQTEEMKKYYEKHPERFEVFDE